MAENLYEAMFVLDADKGGAAFPEAIRLIAGLLTRHEAKIERIEKWDERKFAYPIKGAKRGIYVLVFFRADAAVIAEMRRMIGLSEDILRVLMLRTDELSEVKGTVYGADGEEIAAVPTGVDSAPAAPAEGGTGTSSAGDSDAADEGENDEGDDAAGESDA